MIYYALIHKLPAAVTDDYIVLAEDTSILHMSLNGTDIETLYNDINMRAYGIDYHLA